MATSRRQTADSTSNSYREPEAMMSLSPKDSGSRNSYLATAWSSTVRAPVTYHLYSIWLFTFSDLKTIIVPETAFGVLNAISSKSFGVFPPQPWPMQRLVLVVLWIWINLLPFAIDNQRQPESVEEDRLNKPWRPFPSRRMTLVAGQKLMFVLYGSAIAFSIHHGGLKQCISLIVLGYLYNHCGGSERPVVRNLINACGFMCYGSAATEIALGVSVLQTTMAYWFLIIGAVVFSTVQTQDMYDQAGDSIRGRQTIPLAIGDGLSRWTIACPMSFWSAFCPLFWKSGISGCVISLVLGFSVVFRTLLKRTVKDDLITFRIWNLWLVSLYSLPVIKVYAG